MSTFALDPNSSENDKIAALNYVLSNLGEGGTAANTANVLTANVTTGVISTQGQTVSYLYQYMNVAYANTATGGSFSSNSANKLYYGIHNNTANIADTNPADYQWTQVSGGGFGTTKSLYYQTLGGRQIFFNVGTTSPGYYFRSVQDNVAIDLDDVTSTQAIYSATIYRRGNVTPSTPTGGTYNFGNLFLNPPSGWYANVPPADGNTYVFTSQNTFISSQDFVVAPSKTWTFPTLFTANGAAGATGANGAPGSNGISTYEFNAYTLTDFFPNTPLVNSGSWNFSSGTGTPPLDPNYVYANFPNYGIPPSTITFTQTYNSNVVKIYSNTVSNVSYANVTNTYHTIFANTYTLGNVISGEGTYSASVGASGSVYQDTFTVTGNTAYVDMLLIGAGGDGSAINQYYTPTYSGFPQVQNPAGGTAGNVLIGSNIALPVGTYTVIHGPGANTVLTGPFYANLVPQPGLTLYRARAGAAGDINGNANIVAGRGASITFIGNSTTIGGNVGYPPTIPWNASQLNRGLAISTAHHGGTGISDPWAEITWIGQRSNTYTWPNGAPWSGANVAYFGGGGGAGTDSYPAVTGYPAYTAQQSYGGLGYGGIGRIAATITIPPYAGSGTFGTGAGGGGGVGGNYFSGGYSNNHYQVNNGYYRNDGNSKGAPGALILRQHNPIVGVPQIATWTLLNDQNPTPTETVYSSTTLAFTTNANATVTTLAWQDTIQSSGYQGDAGPRGFVPMAYVATASDPTSYTTGEYSYAFAANRANVALPIGTGYAPIQGDVAQFVYTPTNTIVVKEYNQTANVWTAVNGQVISGNVFVTGSVNATALNANDVYTLNLRGGLGVVGDFNSPGFWMQASTGDARMAGNTSIGNNLTVGNNAVVGNNLGVGNNAIIGASALIGDNLIVGLNAQIGSNLNVGTNAVIGNNLQVGNNAIVGNNFGVGNTAVIGNNLTVGNNAIIGSSLAIGNFLQVGTNATIGNNLTVGNNAVVGNSFGVGNNAVIGNNLTVGNNAIIGASVAIGNNLNIGNNAVIGGNLTVSGLVTAGSLQANTVSTTTMVPDSVTATSGLTAGPITYLSPTTTYAGYDSAYGVYNYITANVTSATSLSCTTNSVTNIVSGFIDLIGTVTAGSTYTPQMYGTILRVVGSNVQTVAGTYTFTPAYTTFPGGSIHYTTQAINGIVRLNDTSIIDQFRLSDMGLTPPQTVAYLFQFGSYVGVTANTAPTIGYDQAAAYSLTATNYKR